MTPPLRPLVLLLLLGAFADASTISEMGDFFSGYYDKMFQMFRAWNWVIAYIPLIAFFWALYAAHERTKVKMEQDQHHSRAGTQTLPTYIFYVVGTLLAIYLVLGVFGLVFAKAPELGSVWDRLVMSYWRNIL